MEGVVFVLEEGSVILAYTNLRITSLSLTDDNFGGAAPVADRRVRGGRGGRETAGRIGLVITASRFNAVSAQFPLVMSGQFQIQGWILWVRTWK